MNLIPTIRFVFNPSVPHSDIIAILGQIDVASLSVLRYYFNNQITAYSLFIIPFV